MNFAIILAFLFGIGSLFGWVLELFYRRFFSSANPERRWINPGFLAGPYLPLYGFSLCALFLMSYINLSFIDNKILRKICLFIVMAIIVTVIEYIAGLIFITNMKIKLWDYENEWGNIKGIICPRYSFYWTLLSAGYYFLIHPRILNALYWLSKHLLFSFFIGFFYGVLYLDFWYSMSISNKIKSYVDDKEIIIRYEELKTFIRQKGIDAKENPRFFFGFRMDRTSFSQNLKEFVDKEVKKRKDFMDETHKIFDEAKEKVGEYIEGKIKK
ncbi:Putative ABC-transporter type IV [Lachnospiraceae bacterium RM5]|nr:Putative ABC-transporter type IV [Lachnospiraceae bacterium RM5]